MNDKHREKGSVELQYDNGEYAVRRSYRSNIVAIIVCLVLAFAVWIVVMNAEDTNYIPLSISGVPEGYICVLSDSVIEVKGTVLSLKLADKAEIIFPEDAKSAGTYSIALEDLVLPAGVSLASGLDITITVEPKK